MVISPALLPFCKAAVSISAVSCAKEHVEISKGEVKSNLNTISIRSPDEL